VHDVSLFLDFSDMFYSRVAGDDTFSKRVLEMDFLRHNDVLF